MDVSFKHLPEEKPVEEAGPSLLSAPSALEKNRNLMLNQAPDLAFTIAPIERPIEPEVIEVESPKRRVPTLETAVFCETWVIKKEEKE